MGHLLNSILSKNDAARLRKIYGVRGDEYPRLIEYLVTITLDYESFGVLGLNDVFCLTMANLAEVHSVEVDSCLNDFMVVSVSKKLLKALHRGMDILMDDPNFDRIPRITGTEDPYMRPFDELGGIAEHDPNFADLPQYSHWGEDCFLMTEERLNREIEIGDCGRLLHRTPYRPMPRGKCKEPLRDD